MRHIEYGPLAAFFARKGELSAELREYFASFQQVVSWLFDPDGIFQENLERAGVRHFRGAYEKITDQQHASVQLARGLERIAIFLDDSATRLFPDASSQSAAAAWLAEHGAEKDERPLIALHAGSGSEKKNWPLGNWQRLADRLAATGARLLLIGGEADTTALDTLQRNLAIHTPHQLLVARNLPLPTLAALLARSTRYFGHDTGVSHIAAAVGAPSTLLFGPTDPAVWAPPGEHVSIIRAPGGDLASVALEAVLAT